MSLDEDVRLLSSTAFFRVLPTTHLQLLAFRAEKARLRTNEILYRPGDSATCAYVLLEGSISIFREKEGQKIPIGEAKKGSVLVETALISPVRHLSGAIVTEDTCLMIIERRAFRRILEEYPETALALYKKIENNFQEMVSRIQNFSGFFEN